MFFIFWIYVVFILLIKNVKLKVYGWIIFWKYLFGKCICEIYG